ncbi:mannose-1-phosphate guanylyltransferase [Olea europaea subsp. europaea]|uniref:Mannose-1-phosphate guanylyltransferase n=1 Tax=Olea europaea subsp. europaea TaxID=158383 RepID=A0A8S0SXX3_OLEEU|nr:mannose-1-phosphate guanylyltransferase [Olea europaea subsp. europaea]
MLVDAKGLKPMVIGTCCGCCYPVTIRQVHRTCQKFTLGPCPVLVSTAWLCTFNLAGIRARFALPRPEKKSITAYVVLISANKNLNVMIKPMALPPVGNSSNREKGFSMQNCKSIIGEATTPERPVEVNGVRLSCCTIMWDRIKSHACLASIVGCCSTVGQWARKENMTILGEMRFTATKVVLSHKDIYE